jgi:SPP1 family predicted phage head-tail adaptor
MPSPEAPLRIDAGELRTKVQLQQPVSAQSATGMPQTDWTTVATVWAGFATAGTREVFQAGQLTSQVSHVVKIRWIATPLQAGYRVLYGTRVLKIQAIVNVLERNRVLLLHCLELNGVQ